nr:hypothetical protein PanWU01x14_224140 [Ipomoea batatas]
MEAARSLFSPHFTRYCMLYRFPFLWGKAISSSEISSIFPPKGSIITKTNFRSKNLSKIPLNAISGIGFSTKSDFPLKLILYSVILSNSTSNGSPFLYPIFGQLRCNELPSVDEFYSLFWSQGNRKNSHEGRNPNQPNFPGRDHPKASPSTTSNSPEKILSHCFSVKNPAIHIHQLSINHIVSCKPMFPHHSANPTSTKVPTNTHTGKWSLTIWDSVELIEVVMNMKKRKGSEDAIMNS